MRARPDIYGYLDLREYLNAWLDYERARNPGFSYATFAESSGLSRSALPNVVSGQRTPSPATLDGIARGLALVPAERNYLGMLVKLARAATVADRRQVLDEMLSRAAYRLGDFVESHGEQMVDFGARWYYQAVIELARLKSFRADPEWIVESLLFEIEVGQAREALDALVSLGLIVLTDDGGATVPILRLRTADETAARASMAFHEIAVPSMIARIRDVPAPERHLAGGVVLIPSVLLPEAKAILSKAASVIATLGDEQTVGPRRAYLYAMHLMPMSHELE